MYGLSLLSLQRSRFLQCRSLHCCNWNWQGNGLVRCISTIPTPAIYHTSLVR